MLTGWRLTVSKLFIIPQRYVLGIMGFLAIVNAYTMRVTLNIAITEMVIPVNESIHPDPEACVVEDDSSSHSDKPLHPEHLYPWDRETQGIILSSFYWGYLITHLPGGILAERFGGKYTLGLGILSTAVFTLITPTVIHLSDGKWQVLVALRVIEGLGEGTTYPAINTLLAQWVPLHERAKIGSLVYAGGQIGTVLSNLVSGALIQATNDWSSVFYVFGGIGVLWFVLFTLICYSTPEDHPFISDEEKSYLKKELDNVSKEKLPIPWVAILTSIPLWALVCAQVGHDWGFYTMVTDLPTYFKDVLKSNIGENGVWSSLPYIVMWTVSMVSGYLCDWLIRKNYMTVTFSRKFFTTLGECVHMEWKKYDFYRIALAASVGPAIFLVLASYSGCDRVLSVSMFTIGMGFMGTFYCGMKVNALDLSPNFAGTLMAIVNGVGAITGIISPYIAGSLTANHTKAEWRIVFWISFAIFNVTNLIYLFFASGEEQWWNNPKRNAVDNAEKGENSIPMESKNEQIQ
ncbi:putative inorganic phosphate cotransporter isoform X2 [Coccinella septempunctata]|uniref:putative inorganic phosphate cotransporter isoform X2 n=1 Tax=Coccinella septempunctata TaxID=41139 RepID=UPI001D083A03|nr:putative inorganic phosphate cotransporter isoform X2 [Coccinella septempunctata]